MIIVLAWYRTMAEWHKDPTFPPGPRAVVWKYTEIGETHEEKAKAEVYAEKNLEFFRIYLYAGAQQDFLADARERIKEEYDDYCNSTV